MAWPSSTLAGTSSVSGWPRPCEASPRACDRRRP
jgi:hypothetical protein